MDNKSSSPDIKSLNYRVGFQDGEQNAALELHRWWYNEKREPALTAFTAGPIKDLAILMEEISGTTKEKTEEG